MDQIREYISEINTLHRICATVYHNAAAGMGLSDSAFDIFCTLMDLTEPCTQSDLCDELSVSRQTFNSSLKKLEKDGYVELKKIEGKKGKTIHLTDKGKTFIEEKLEPVMQAEDRVCQSITEEEKQSFITIYRKLALRLKEEMENDCMHGL